MVRWLKGKSLKLNPENMEVVPVGMVEVLKDMVLPTTVGVPDSVKSLGVILDRELFLEKMVMQPQERHFASFI